METVSGFKRFIVCIVSQSKSRGLNLFYICFFVVVFQFHLIIIIIKLIKIIVK